MVCRGHFTFALFTFALFTFALFAIVKCHDSSLATGIGSSKRSGIGVVGQPIWSQRFSSIDGQPIVAAGNARGTVNTISWVACDCAIRLQATRSEGFSFVDYNVWFQCSAFLPAAVRLLLLCPARWAIQQFSEAVIRGLVRLPLV